MGAVKIVVALLALATAMPAAADPVDCWSAQIAEAAARFGVPADWIRRVMRVESGGRESIGGRPPLSRAGATGLMQLMPATWRDMRTLAGLGADPNDPRDNILAGTLYLRLMYGRFGYPGLFAAYNAGPARYSAYLAGGGSLPRETRTYVARLAGPETLGGDPARLGPARRALVRAPSQSAASAVAGGLVPTPAGLFVALQAAPGR